MEMRLNGLIAATYTPLDQAGALNLEAIDGLVDYLIASGVQGLYVCGSTGEGVSLTIEERFLVAESYVRATKGRVPVIVQVGHNSLREAGRLAAHAQHINADAISATCPSYFKVTGVSDLVDCMREVAVNAPDLPFYYYHIPALTGSSLDIASFMQRAGGQISNLVGLKYTDTKLHEFQRCLNVEKGRYDVVWGCDEMLLGAVASGAKAAIGSTYNIATPLYRQLIEALQGQESGGTSDQVRFDEARRLQLLSVQMIDVIYQFPFHSAMKAVLGFLGHEMGSCRLPQQSLDDKQRAQLKANLESIGFFDWAVGATEGRLSP